MVRVAGEHRPDLLPRYRKLYRRGAYATKEERRAAGAGWRAARAQDGPRDCPASGEPVRAPAGAAPGRRRRRFF